MKILTNTYVSNTLELLNNRIVTIVLTGNTQIVGSGILALKNASQTWFNKTLDASCSLNGFRPAHYGSYDYNLNTKLIRYKTAFGYGTNKFEMFKNGVDYSNVSSLTTSYSAAIAANNQAHQEINALIAEKSSPSQTPVYTHIEITTHSDIQITNIMYIVLRGGDLSVVSISDGSFAIVLNKGDTTQTVTIGSMTQTLNKDTYIIIEKTPTAPLYVSDVYACFQQVSDDIVVSPESYVTIDVPFSTHYITEQTTLNILVPCNIILADMPSGSVVTMNLGPHGRCTTFMAVNIFSKRSYGPNHYVVLMLHEQDDLYFWHPIVCKKTSLTSPYHQIYGDVATSFFKVVKNQYSGSTIVYSVKTNEPQYDNKIVELDFDGRTLIQGADYSPMSRETYGYVFGRREDGFPIPVDQDFTGDNYPYTFNNSTYVYNGSGIDPGPINCSTAGIFDSPNNTSGDFYYDAPLTDGEVFVLYYNANYAYIAVVGVDADRWCHLAHFKFNRQTGDVVRTKYKKLPPEWSLGLEDKHHTLRTIVKIIDDRTEYYYIVDMYTLNIYYMAVNMVGYDTQLGANVNGRYYIIYETNPPVVYGRAFDDFVFLKPLEDRYHIACRIKQAAQTSTSEQVLHLYSSEQWMATHPSHIITNNFVIHDPATTPRIVPNVDTYLRNLNNFSNLYEKYTNYFTLNYIDWFITEGRWSKAKKATQPINGFRVVMSDERYVRSYYWLYDRSGFISFYKYRIAGTEPAAPDTGITYMNTDGIFSYDYRGRSESMCVYIDGKPLIN